MDKDAVNGTTDLTEFKNVHSSMYVSLTVQTETVGYGIAHVGRLDRTGQCGQHPGLHRHRRC